MNTLGVISARYKSSRFPGKMLTKIMGKPLLSWSIENAQKVDYITDLIVATDDDIIVDFVKKNHSDIEVVKTKEARSATERTFFMFQEHREKCFYDWYMSIPADEPFIDPNELNEKTKPTNIGKLVLPKSAITTLYTKFYSFPDLESKQSCKIASNLYDYAVYFSRAKIPATKDGEYLDLDKYKKHVGIFFFHHIFFEDMKNTIIYKYDWKSELEAIEGLEQNRFIDLSIPIKLIEIRHNYYGIDTPGQVKLIEDRYKYINDVEF